MSHFLTTHRCAVRAQTQHAKRFLKTLPRLCKQLANKESVNPQYQIDLIKVLAEFHYQMLINREQYDAFCAQISSSDVENHLIPLLIINNLKSQYYERLNSTKSNS
jgi:hypothetical protein